MRAIHAVRLRADNIRPYGDSVVNNNLLHDCPLHSHWDQEHLAGFRLFPRAGSRASRPPRGRAPRGRARVLPGAGTRREGTRVPCPAQGCLPASLTEAAWASAGPSGSDESALSSLPEPAPGVSGSPRAT